MFRNTENRGVAQLVARCVRDAKVVGSNPVASTKNSRSTKSATAVFGFKKKNRSVYRRPIFYGE